MSDITLQEVLGCSDPVYDAFSDDVVYYEVLPKHFDWLVKRIQELEDAI